MTSFKLFPTFRMRRGTDALLFSLSFVVAIGILSPHQSSAFPHYARDYSKKKKEQTQVRSPEPEPLSPEMKAMLDEVSQTSAAPVDAPTNTSATKAPTADTRPVTQDQFKTLIKNYKLTLERLRKLEQKGSGSGDELVLGSSESASTTAPAAPTFRTFFDLNLINRPGVQNFTFDNFHAFLLFEVMPTPDIQFSFDVSTSPRYYELDYQLLPGLQMRAGKIWIPFDDTSPHNIFGGRVNVSRLAVVGAPAFLPDLWTDLGLGLKWIALDRSWLTLTTHLYVVNGFQSGGTDPLNPTSPYPSLSDLPTGSDNNRDKAFGGRIHSLLWGKWGVGFSFYNGRWTSDSIESKRLTLLGVDSQFRIARTELRAGLASFSMPLPTGDTAKRGGFYGEVGQRFGGKEQFKALLRGGLLQMDDRVLDTSPDVVVGDQTVVGATLLWKPNMIEYSIEHSRDLKKSPSKKNYSYTAARIVIAL